MPSEQYNTTYHRFVDEVINRGNFAIGEQLISPDFVNHTPSRGSVPTVPASRSGFIPGQAVSCGS